ncbi:MAG: glycosyltransferase family 39 protein [Proteobacteria bacterium]|nr:glycosyltransferase family 39 protein [Pseudomonadota bacterium]
MQKIARGHAGFATWPHLALWALIAVLVIPTIGAGGFWWTDEARHAMGGVFILDFIRDLPLSDPLGYAMRYFAQYPALALNWYLPGFYAAEAALFGLFGASEAAAHWTVIAFCALGASVWFAWTREGWGPLPALVATASFLAVPEWNFWARSVMLEAPAIAMFVLSVWCFERYLDRPTFTRALVAGLVIALALSIKQTVALLLPALFVYGLWTPRRSALLRVQALPAYLLVIVALAVVALHAIKFGSLGLAATVGDNRVDVGQSAGRLSLERWMMYPHALVKTWGWPLLVLSAVGITWPSRKSEARLPLLYAWLGCWYLAMTLLLGSAGNAPRYTLYAFPALAMFAARPLFLLQDRPALRNAMLAALLIVLGFNVWRSLNQAVPYVNGYREAAEFIQQSETQGPVLFAGKHDGNFIFHLRRLDDRRNDVVLRADKVLVSLAVHKYFGMESHVSSLDDIQSLIDRYGVEFIAVEQPDIVRVKEFGMLHELLQRPEFERVAVLPVTSGGRAEAPDRIEIYRYRNYKPSLDTTIVIPLPHMGTEIRFERDARR